MYQGNNPTALTSQKMLLDSLNELLKEKEFKDISVSEICSHSGISRQTFYSLFGTKAHEQG
jgi:AcrR family transcriptional regulator